MKYTQQLSLLLCMMFSTILVGQHGLNPCGSVGHRSDWLKRYQQNPAQFDTRSGVTTYVPIKIHLVATDDGVGLLTHDKLYDAMCTLQADFAQAEIEFFVDGEIDYVFDSEFFNHDNVNFGAQKMLQYNVENAINCYFVQGAAGNCGYNVPYAGVVNAHNCVNPKDHTWAHEIGHNLALPHTFLGWEGGVSYDGSVPANFGQPAPTTVTYNYTDFKDRPYPDTLIIDTAYVETVDRSNCSFAADGFCDTKPDYIAARWPCNAEGLSNVEQTDPNGEVFRSDASYIMSYAQDACSGVITPEQSAAMKANLTDQKPGYLYNQTPPVIIPEGTVVNYLLPAEGEIVPVDKATFEWEPVEGATRYLFKIALDKSLNTNFYDTVVYTTTFSTGIREDIASRKLYYAVVPLTDHSFCAEFVEGRQFEASGDISNTDGSEVISLALTPNILAGDQTATVTGISSDKIDQIMVYSVGGQLVSQSKKENFITTDASWTSGLYIVQIKSEGKSYVQKLIVE